MFKNRKQLFRKIESMESQYERVRDIHEECRKYYEDDQTPSGLPDGITYIVNNRIMPHVNLQIAKEVGGSQTESLKGSGDFAEAQRHFLRKTLENNKFKELLLEKCSNYRQVEGEAGWHVVYNPFRISEFGKGDIELRVIRPDNLGLDENSEDPWHSDDRVRYVRVRYPVEQAKRNPNWEAHWDDIGPSNTNSTDTNDAEDSDCDLYFVEFYETFFIRSFYDPAIGDYVPLEQAEFNEQDGDFVSGQVPNEKNVSRFAELARDVPSDTEFEPIVVEHKVFFACKVINKQVLVEPPKPTYMGGFTITPSFHTINNEFKRGVSSVHYLRRTQDRLNVSDSMIRAESERNLKNPTFVSGASPPVAAQIKREKGKISPVIYFRNPNARVHTPPPIRISDHMIQAREIDLQNFDHVGATGDPDRGQVQDVSGKLYIAAINQSDKPLFNQVTHLAESLVDPFRRILEIAQLKFNEPFTLMREIAGKETGIRFNERVEDPESFESDEFHVLFEESGIINDFSQGKIPEITVDIETDTALKKQNEQLRAQVMFNMGQLHPEHLHKAIMGEQWPETLEKAREFNAALQIDAMMEGFDQDARGLALQQFKEQVLPNVQAASQQLKQLEDNGVL